MLGIDHQRAGRRKVEPGADPGVFGGSGEVGFEGRNREEVYGWVNQTLSAAASIEELKRRAAGTGAALRGEDDRAEPGADDAADHGVSGRGGGASRSLTGGNGFRSATRGRTSSCWRRWMRPTKP